MNNVVALATPTNTTHDDVRLHLRTLMDSDRSLTQSRIAKEAGISSTTLSQWLNGVYGGDNAAVEAKLRRWIDTTLAARETAAAMPEAPTYVETPSSARVIGALRYAQIAGDIAVIYGGAGVSKTTTALHYQRQAPNVWVATMTPATAGVVPALQEIAEAVGAATTGGAATLYRAITRRVQGANGLLVIDESQHLGTQALDQIRAIHDATQVGIALVGNEQVYARMTGGNRAAYLDRLFSRIGKKVRLIRPNTGDVDALLDAWGVDGKCRADLREIASKPGALRVMTKILRLASMYAAAESRRLCCDDVRAAWRELGGAE